MDHADLDFRCEMLEVDGYRAPGEWGSRYGVAVLATIAKTSEVNLIDG